MLAEQEEIHLPQDPSLARGVQPERVQADIPISQSRGHPKTQQDVDLADTASSTHPFRPSQLVRIPSDISEDLADPHIVDLPRNVLRHELRRLVQEEFPDKGEDNLSIKAPDGIPILRSPIRMNPPENSGERSQDDLLSGSHRLSLPPSQSIHKPNSLISGSLSAPRSETPTASPPLVACRSRALAKNLTVACSYRECRIYLLSPIKVKESAGVLLRENEGRVLGRFSKHGIFGYDELCRFRQRSTKALDLADRKAVTPESGDHLAALELTLHRLRPHAAHCFPERRNGRWVEEAAAPKDR
ncbi:hypothetical protein MA16_Dca024689 [Dendrobium catenatum]|uniref:Uncharacterized protein n=1 Tax=Dendrobium catenatum TaxID=906689 RepID=A0A2I0VG46_9ASPA|nr:hypothetical protein MA16_Dca024689 [Dendrobium catenatum]